MTECKLCGNEMREQETSFCACDANPPVKFENVPAKVCIVCGDKVFSQRVVEAIQRLSGTSVNYRHAAIRVYDYRTADHPARSTTESYRR